MTCNYIVRQREQKGSFHGVFDSLTDQERCRFFSLVVEHNECAWWLSYDLAGAVVSFVCYSCDSVTPIRQKGGDLDGK